jgi:hypothetical protein
MHKSVTAGAQQKAVEEGCMWESEVQSVGPAPHEALRLMQCRYQRQQAQQLTVEEGSATAACKKKQGGHNFIAENQEHAMLIL